jgi:hypothetical protein
MSWEPRTTAQTCYSWISWAPVVTRDPELRNTQHDNITVHKIFPPHPQIPFPHLPGLLIKRRGNGFKSQKDTGNREYPVPSQLSWHSRPHSIVWSASWRSPRLPLLSFSAPRLCTARSSLHHVSLCCYSRCSHSLAMGRPHQSFLWSQRPQEKRENFLTGYKTSWSFSSELLFLCGFSPRTQFWDSGQE